MKRTILLVESDRSYLRVLQEHVAEMEFFAACYTATEGKSAAKLALKHRPDLVVTSLVLSGIDGFGLIAYLKEKLPETLFAVSTALKTDFAVKQASELGVQLYFAKPTPFYIFRDRIVQLLESGASNNFVIQREDSDILWLITREIQKIGFPANIKGFSYVRQAIYFMAEADRPQSMMKEIYPAVAEKFGTTPACVERDIRHGIEVAWTRGSMQYIDEVFGFTVDADKGKPTNAAFIMTIAERVRLLRM